MGSKGSDSPQLSTSSVTSKGTDFARPSSSSSPWSNTGQYTFGSTVASSLASPSATSSWDLSTSGASPIYGNTSDAVVFRYSRVSGVVWGLGWDFYDSGRREDGPFRWGRAKTVGREDETREETVHRKAMLTVHGCPSYTELDSEL